MTTPIQSKDKLKQRTQVGEGVYERTHGKR